VDQDVWLASCSIHGNSEHKAIRIHRCLWADPFLHASHRCLFANVEQTKKGLTLFLSLYPRGSRAAARNYTLDTLERPDILKKKKLTAPRPGRPDKPLSSAMAFAQSATSCGVEHQPFRVSRDFVLPAVSAERGFHRWVWRPSVGPHGQCRLYKYGSCWRSCRSTGWV